MKISYNGLIKEINSEVEEGVLSPNDTIQILRDETPAFENYFKVIDWYYDDFIMQEELDTPLEEMYLPEEFSDEEWKDMKKEQEELKVQYFEDKPKLTSVKVKDILTEMKQMQKLFK